MMDSVGRESDTHPTDDGRERRLTVAVSPGIVWCLIDVFQTALLEVNKYRTLPGKRSKRSDLNGSGEGEGEGEGGHVSPAQLSPSHSHQQDYSLSEFRPLADANARRLLRVF